MTITKQEVRTIYDIQFTHADFLGVVEWYRESEAQRILFPNAFDFELKDETLVSAVRNFFEKMQFRGTGDTAGVIAKYFGFDGWLNAGYYDERKKVFKMAVYNEGREYIK